MRTKPNKKYLRMQTRMTMVIVSVGEDTQDE